MRVTTFFIFLILTSGVLFTPFLQPGQEVEMVPGTPTSVIVNMRSTNLEISTDISSSIELNISLIQSNGDKRNIQINAILLDNAVYTLQSSGSYEITIISGEFGVVTFSQSGITTAQLIYFTVISIVFLFVLSRNYGLIS